MYTLGDIMGRYNISEDDLRLPPDFKSVYQIDAGADNVLITNKRESDIFTQKVAYGSRQDTASHGQPLYVCHPQYNNLPGLLPGETTVLRPDTACGIPQHGIPHTLIRDCVCGIIARTYTLGSDQKHVATIVRIIPQTAPGQGSSALPGHGIVTELGESALRTGNVLSIGTMTPSTSKTLPVVYFATDPSAAHSDETSPSLPGQYDICSEQSDPDNINSLNRRNPYILDGIVVPLGKTKNPDYVHDDCCNFIRPHARIIALGAPNTTKSRVAFVEGGSADSGSSILSELWNTMALPCSAPQRSVQGWNTDNDTNSYPCSVTVMSDATTPAGSDLVFIFDRVYVKKRGWIVVLFSSTLRACAQEACWSQVPSGLHTYNWRVQHVRTASVTQDVANNYNIPNDAHMWEIGELMFGGADGVGTCAQRCPSSGEYQNVRGTIRWKPKIIPAATNVLPHSQYWLYTVFSVGESLACKFYNCDEVAFAAHHTAKYADDIPNPDGQHPLTFFEGTSMTVFIPHKRPHAILAGCIRLDPTAIQYEQNTQSNAVTFRMSHSLFGEQRVTDFAFCTACIEGSCQLDVMPCRWQASIDSTWWYYMFLYWEVGGSGLFAFRVNTPGVQDSEYSEQTEFKGYTVSSAPGASNPVFVPGFTGDASTASNISLFTTRAHRCASSNISTDHSTLHTREANAPSTWTARRVNAHPQHGRKTHVRRHFAATVNPSHVLSRIHTEKMQLQRAQPVVSVDEKRACKRFLLAVNSPKTLSPAAPASIGKLHVHSYDA